MKDWIGNKASVFRALGASNHSLGEREDNDYYATDPKAAELLCDLMEFSPVIWECACGEGHLAKVFERRGYVVKATDLIDRGYGEGGVDFLKCETPFYGDIITNPPYKYAREFIEKALSLIPIGSYVAMFLKLSFLEGKSRKAFFSQTPPSKSSFHLHAYCALRTVISRSTPARLSLMDGLYGKRAFPDHRLLNGLTERIET